MKQTQQRLIAAAVLLVVAVVLVLVVRGLNNREGEAEPTAEVEALPPLFPDQAAGFPAVTALTLRNPATGETLTLQQRSGVEEDEGGESDDEAAAPSPLTLAWEVTSLPESVEDPGLGVDGEQIQSALFPLPGITPTRELTDVEASLGQFGLEPPQYELTFQTDFGPTFELLIGTPTPTGSGYYVQLPGDNTVFIVPAASIEGVVSFFEQPPLVQPTPEAPPEEGEG